MANTLKFGNGEWYGKKDTILAYNDLNSNFKPLPFNFSRDSKATVVNKDGLIETVGSGQPRIDYLNDSKGALLLEPSRSNIVPYSSIFSIWTQVNGASVSDTTDVISPDGTLNAELLVSGGNGNVQGIYKNISFLNATTYTMSVFAKKKEISFIQLQGGGAGWSGNTFANFDLENGIVGNIGSGAISSSIENYGNGWYRCSFTATKNASGGNLSIDLINSATDGRDTSYNGNIGDGFYIYGVQAEANSSYATSYIPTQGSIVTRLAESCNGAGNDQVFNDSEGVLYTEISALDEDAGTERYIYIGNGTTANRVVIRYSTTQNDIRMLVTSGGSTQVSSGTTNYNITENHKIALKYKANDFALWIDGVEVLTDTNGSTPTGINQLTLSYSGTQFYGNTKQIKYFNQALTDQELQALTS